MNCCEHVSSRHEMQRVKTVQTIKGSVSLRCQSHPDKPNSILYSHTTSRINKNVCMYEQFYIAHILTKSKYISKEPHVAKKKHRVLVNDLISSEF